MLRKFQRKSRAQSTAEYAILIGLVIAAAVAMQVYLKRTIQGRMHRAVKYMANAIASENEEWGMESSTQYEPYYIRQDYRVTRDQDAQQNLYVGGVYNASENATIIRTGSQNILGTEGQD